MSILVLPASIPSPPTGVWYLGPLPLRAYAMFIIVGIIFAWWLSQRRWQARGGRAESLDSVLLGAIVAGIIGARLYHVITDYQLYFGPGRNPVRALYIWEGGLGIWGAVAAGALAVWIGCRRRGMSFAAVADAVAPGLIFAQAIGRLGNYFNQELFGAPTTLPWGLEIDIAHRPAGYEQFATFHPTFLYELLWNVAVGLVLLWADRRFRMGHGRVFVGYVALYTFGRFWVEGVRIDTANHILGMRVNEWVSIIMFVAAAALFVWLSINRPRREDVVDAAENSQATDEAVNIEAGDTDD